jgi:hypothetical protein
VIVVVHPTLFKVMLRFSANWGRIFAENPVMTLEPVACASMVTDVVDRRRFRPILLPRPKAVLLTPYPPHLVLPADHHTPEDDAESPRPLVVASPAPLSVLRGFRG